MARGRVWWDPRGDPRSEAGRKVRRQAPVFVVGCPRSGTTLLYHMLLSAGNFAIYRAESQVFNLLEPRFGNLSVESNKRAMLKAWYGSPLFQKTGLNREEIEPLIMAECRNGGDFLRLVMEAMGRRQGTERWADCTPEHVLYLRRIKEAIPDALIIHVVRDGRDVALSLEKQGWIKPFAPRHRLEAAALYWDWIVSRGRVVGRSLGEDYLEIRYEELVTDPRGSMRVVSDFVEHALDYDQIRKVGIGSVQRPNTSFSADLHGGEFHPVGRWKNCLSQQQKETIDALVGDTLEELGYSDKSGRGKPDRQASLQRLHLLYHTYFSTKFFLKTRTPLGRWLTARDLSWT